jgi:hypothetical protein
MAAMVEAAYNEEMHFNNNSYAENIWTSTSTITSTKEEKQPTLTTEQLQELITQFQFLLVRNTNDDTVREQLDIILYQLTANQMTKEKKELLVIMYKLIGKTRDIHNGKGEYHLTNMMIIEWLQYYPNLARYAVKTIVSQVENHKSFGSWKDIKYLCLYIKNQTYYREHHPLIRYCIELINMQLRLDDGIIQASEVGQNPTISLAAKWAARESSGKFGWLNRPLAEDYFQEFMVTAKTPEKQRKASIKCQTHYRKLLSKLNKHLDTIQIKQCAQKWATIDHSKTTSITLKNQAKVLLNLTKNGEQRSEDPDRVACAENFQAFVEGQKKDKKDLSSVNSQRTNVFSDKGIDAVKECTPWLLFISSLNKPEYKCLEDTIRRELV